MFLIFLINLAIAGEIIIANNTRVTYDFGHEIKPYIANEIKFISKGKITEFDANKFRIGFRYKLNDNIRIDPHIFVDNKQKNNWVFSPGPGVRVDFTL